MSVLLRLRVCATKAVCLAQTSSARRAASTPAPPPSALARAFLARSRVARAAAQLRAFPEVAAADAALPPGSNATLLGVPVAARAELMRGLQRVAEVCAGLPGAPDAGAGAPPMLQAALLRYAALAEACADLPAARRCVNAVQALHERALGADLPGGLLSRMSGFERNEVAEALLAAARLRLLTAQAGPDGGGDNGLGDLRAADAALQHVVRAAANVEDMQYLQTASGDEAAAADDSAAPGGGPRERLTQSLAALLPNALALTRAHALLALVSRLLGTAAPPPPQDSPAVEMAASSGPPQQKPLPHTLPALHLQVVLNCCDAADLIVAGTVDPRSAASVAASAHAARYTHGRTALVRAAARRNVASSLLLDAAESLTGVRLAPRPAGSAAAAAAAATEAAVTSFGRRAVALSLTTQAHAQLTQALEPINLALTRLRDLADSSVANPSGVSASKSASSVGSGSSDAEAAAALTRPAWARLTMDLRHMRLELTSAAAELSLIAALAGVWQVPALAPASGLAAAVPAAAPQGRDASAAIVTPLFPLAEDQAEAVAPVLRTVLAAAEAALREAEGLEAAARGGACAGDHGPDAGCGVARPLALLALLQFVVGRAVTGEGLFRAAVARFSELRMPVAAVAKASAAPEAASSGLAADAARWCTLPALHQAHLGAALHSYGLLLRQWERREAEASAVTAEAGALLRRAARPFGLAVPPAFAEGAGLASVSEAEALQQAFMGARLFSAALTTAHVGSASAGLLQDYATI